MVIMEKGNPAGNELVREILAMGISKYKLHKDIGVSDTQVYKWVRGEQSPCQSNYQKLQEYWQYQNKLQRIPKPFGR